MSVLDLKPFVHQLCPSFKLSPGKAPERSWSAIFLQQSSVSNLWSGEDLALDLDQVWILVKSRLPNQSSRKHTYVSEYFLKLPG